MNRATVRVVQAAIVATLAVYVWQPVDSILGPLERYLLAVVAIDAAIIAAVYACALHAHSRAVRRHPASSARPKGR